MSSVQPAPGGHICGGASLEELYRDVMRSVDAIIVMAPRDLKKEVDEAERRVVKLRNCLIDRLRQDSGSSGPSRWRKPLDRVNVALSLIAAIDYPATGIRRRHLEDAQQVLRSIERHLPD